MGVVYLARDERLDRRIALKVIAPHLALDKEFRERFGAEARSAAAIEHPHAVPVYSSGVADGSLYIAMRYIEGTDLRSALRSSGPLTPAAAVTIVSEVAGALDAAHAAGMVHRDVKPANILLEGEPGRGKSYLTDFGLTKGRSESEAQLTGTGQWVGTIDYVAPEQIQSGRVDARTDVYALGCVLYEALTGTVPFSGNDMQKMWGHVNEPFPELARAHTDAAGDLPAVISRATAKDPNERFPSAGDLARSAAAALTGGAIDVPERSVATGSAAKGLAENIPAGSPPNPGDQAATVTGRAPVHPRESQTTRMPSPPQRKPNRPGGGTRTAAIIGGALVIAAGLLAAAVVLAGNNSPDNTQKNAASGNTKGANSPRGKTTPSSTLAADLEPCSPTVSVRERLPGKPYTSCPFAREVERAYYQSGESTQISAYSPKTGKVYPMRCGGSNPIVCSGGTEAAVYITPTSSPNPEPTTASTSATGDWPGGSAYSAMLGAFSTEANARSRQQEATERGLDAGVLYSSDFSSLTPGYWVVFSGTFDSAEEAEARADLAHSVGYSDAYPRFVAP